MPSLSPDQIIRDEIRALSAYHVPEASGMVKLDAMENPFGLPEGLRAEIGAIARDAALNRYPDASAAALKERLQTAMDIPAGMELMLGNGSDELIQIIALCAARPGAVLLGVEPSFVMYRMIASFVGMRYVGVPLREDFTLDLDAMLAAVEAERPAVIFLAYPNNPTGNLFDADAVSRIIEAAPGLVVVDEAYHAFAGASFMPRLAAYPNLVVMRTLSKLGLAGLRLGFLAGSPAWLGHFEKVRLPYNINVLTQQVAHKVLEHVGILNGQAATLKAERTGLKAQLDGMAGVQAYPSDANFILIRVGEADRVFDGLRQRGILIKNLSHAHPLLRDCLRVTVGTPEENAKFINALQELV